MVGLGEAKEEIIQVMDDLKAADVDFFNHRSIFATFYQTPST